MKGNQIFQEELMLVLRERLNAGQKVRFLAFRGVSMKPMLRQGKDSVELAPLPKRLQKYDLPVYQYPSGKYVMHRVIEVREDCYVCMGDNTYSYEYIKPEWMVAVVSAFKRGDREISVDAPLYRFYSRLWVALYPIRKPAHRVYHGLKRRLRP